MIKKWCPHFLLAWCFGVFLALETPAVLNVKAIDLKVAWDGSPDAFAYKLYVYSSKTNTPFILLSLATNFFISDLNSSNFVMFVTALGTNGLESVSSRVIHYPPDADCFEIGTRADVAPGYRSEGYVLVAVADNCDFQVSSDSPWLTITGAAAVGGQTAIYYRVESNRGFQPRDAILKVNDTSIRVTQDVGGPRPPIMLRGLSSSATLSEGEDLRLDVVIEDEPGVTYQWLKNGLPIPGATNQVYSRSSVGIADEGDYSVEIANEMALVRNGPIRVSVLLKPRIQSEGLPKLVIAPIGAPAFISVLVAGEKVQYAWLRDGAVLTNTSSSISFDAVRPEDLGTYEVMVQNEAGSTQAAVAILTTPQMEQEHGRITLNYGGSLSLEVTALGVPGRSYRIESSRDLVHWRLEDTVVVDDGGVFRIDAPTPSESSTAGSWFVRTVRELGVGSLGSTQ